MQNQDPVKDETGAHPVSAGWRPTIRAIVKAFAKSDYALAHPIPSVSPPSSATTKQMKAYVADFGESLAELPNETWVTSASQWTGTHWDVLVDLWTIESGRSDLVLALRIHEDGPGFRFEIDSLHVP